jgi:hypothetical protein
MNADADSVPLDAGAEEAPREKTLPELTNIKILLSLFMIFVVVVSDFFTGNVIAGFGDSAVKGRYPTSWGVVLQGIFMVLFYIAAIYLIKNNIL